MDGTEQTTHEPPSAGALHPGMVLSGRYVIERELGRGGIGVVYLAADRQLVSRAVVVKILLEKSYQDEWIKKKFYQEIEALARIDHPGVVSVFDAGEMEDGKPYLVMQYVEGTPLRQHLGKPMELARAARLINQMSRALSAAHEKGVFHRDLKPENVMLLTTSAGLEEIKLIDFGLAKIQNSKVGESSVVPNVAGSFGYMAPEQLLSRPATAASDLYSLGVIAYEMLTGRRPFLPESVFEMYEMQRRGVEVKPRSLRPDLPPAAETLLLQALAFDPAQRPATVQDFSAPLVRALESAVETEVVHPSLPQPGPLNPQTSSLPFLHRSSAYLAVIPLLGLIKMSFYRFFAWSAFLLKPQILIPALLLIGLLTLVFARARKTTWKMSVPAISAAVILLSVAGMASLPPVISISSAAGKLTEDPAFTINYSDPKGYKYTLVDNHYSVISLNPGRFNDLSDYTLSITLDPEIEFADVYFDRAFHLMEPLLLQPSNTHDILVVTKNGDHFEGVRRIKFSYKYRVAPTNHRVMVTIKTENQEMTYDGQIVL